MDEHKWNRVENLIEQALELPPDEQVAFIQKECGNDEALQHKIHSLLQHGEHAFTFIQNFEENVITPSLTGLARERFDEHQRLDTLVGQYRITDILGSGGMGIVYKATDTRLNRTTALKFLPAHTMYNKGKKKRLLREARAAASLNHPNIATVYEIQETDGQLFIVMEFIDGQSLDDILYSSRDSTPPNEKQKDEHPVLEQDEDLGRPIPVREALDIAIQIAGSLQAAHQKGVIHRDLKSDNIMVTEQGQVKLLDFGLAKIRAGSRLTKEGTTMGTVQYMSPEQASGKEVDHRTDIWSLGVVLYEMLTGKHPFGGANDQAVIYSILNNRPEPPSKAQSEILDELNKLVLKCLEKNPADRYQNAEELIADLRRTRTNISDISDHKQDKWSNEETGEVAAPVAEVKEKPSKPSNLFPKNFSFRSGTALVGLATGLFAFILMVYWLFPFTGSERSSDHSIAVLPLESFSQNEEDIQFTSGVHVELINRLAGIGDLTVIARSSVLGYSPGERDLRAIGRELGVSALLEGTVQRTGHQLRVTVQLTDTDNLGTLWSQSYEEDIDNLFEIQSRIAREVADELQASLSEEEQERLEERPTHNFEAYNFYIQGVDYLNRPKLERENPQTAILLFKRALDEDPQFAHAWAMLAVAYSNLYWLHDITPERLEQVREAAEQAQMLAPDLPETHLAIGVYRYWSEPKNNEQNLSYFESTLERFPNHSFLHAFIGLTHRRLGNWDQVERHLNKAIELDPRNSNRYQELSFFYFLSKEYNKADALLDRHINLAPDDLVYPWIMKAWVDLELNGTLDGYKVWLEKTRPIHPVDIAPYYWGQYLYLSRNWDEAFNVFLNLNRDIAIEYEHTYVHRFYLIAKTLESQGNQTEAMGYYHQVRDTVETLVDRYPNDPRYHAALGKIYARMNEPDKAILEGQKAVELMPISQNAYDGAAFEFHLAEIYTWTGREEQAIEILAHLLTIPSHVHISQNWLRMHPDFDPLRDHPRFRELIAEENELYIEEL